MLGGWGSPPESICLQQSDLNVRSVGHTFCFLRNHHTACANMYLKGQGHRNGTPGVGRAGGTVLEC